MQKFKDLIRSNMGRSLRSDLFLILEIVKKSQFVLIVLCTYRYGLPVMVGGAVISGLLSAIENSLPNLWLIKYPPWRQFWDIMPYVVSALVAAVPAWLVCKSISHNLLCMLVGGVAFSAIYLIVAWLIRCIPNGVMDLKKRFLGA